MKAKTIEFKVEISWNGKVAGTTTLADMRKSYGLAHNSTQDPITLFNKEKAHVGGKAVKVVYINGKKV